MSSQKSSDSDEKCELTWGWLAADDLGAADDRLFAGVAEDDPGLVATVVVGGPELQRRGAVPDRDLLVAGRVDPAPDPHEGVVGPLLADRRRLFVAGRSEER